MVVKHQCSFCATEIEPGTGSMFVKRDGTVFHFCSSSCRKQQLGLGRVGHRLKWTRAHLLKRQTEAASSSAAVRARAKSRAPPTAPAPSSAPAAPPPAAALAAPAPTGTAATPAVAAPAPAGAAASPSETSPAKKPRRPRTTKAPSADAKP